MPRSVKKNFGYNLILTISNYIFPLLTYPYVSRVLGVTRIGSCNFIDGIINYLVLFAAMGIGSYGVREIARCRDNQKQRDEVFTNLVLLNFIGTFIGVIILVVCTLWVPYFSDYKPFLWVGLIKLIFSAFLIEWFFQGIQDFKYVTIRSVIVRSLYVLAVFIFVRNENDTVLYFLICSLTVVMNATINWAYSRKFRSLSLSYLNFAKYIIPVLVFGYYRILTSMYTTFNTVFLGFSSGDTEVGYFSTATKLYGIIMAVFTALTTVMVPKVTEMLSEKRFAELQSIANEIFSLLTIFSIPIIMISQFCAPDIIAIIAGPGYEGAITPFRIVIFMLLVIGMEQIVIQQFLMASTSNKSIFLVSTTGAVVGIGLNFLLTPSMGAIGSAISWSISELSVLVVGLVLSRRILGITLSTGILLKDVLYSLLYIPLLLAVHCLHLNMWLNCAISLLCICAVFFFINCYLNKNTQILSFVNRIFKR